MTELTIYDLRKKKLALSGYTCEICGKPINEYTGQLAHIIPQTKPNIKKYGKDVIHNELNMKIVCGLECNAKCMIGFWDYDKLVKKIKENIK